MAEMATNLFFNKLDKYTGDDDVELSSWIKNFERCCIISNRHNEVVQGQLLMLCVDGRAKAILEDYEETVKAEDAAIQIKAKDYIRKLQEIFQSDATKEVNMSLFDSRIQKLDEAEEEYMYELVKLYKFANPGVPNATMEIAVKRKFLNGISPALRQNIFNF